MNRIHTLFILAFLFAFIACTPKVQDATAKKEETEKKIVTIASTGTEAPALTTVPNDPLKAKIHTLSNGMKIYMSVNKDEPRIQTNIAVRAGSKQDPAETTGLAHYLEHMLFKGTNKMASLDWEKEKVLLQEISDLYEKHRSTKNETQRNKIYNQIDSVSNIAAQYVAANEYDKLLSGLGAKGTNAYTWYEQTVYINDIPSNELEKWMEIESERFKMVVLRLFHTELEAVYEEFNINQDRDSRKSNKALMEGLFPHHPYGTQTTIGTGEHLKNPSHVKIQEYFKKHYVPNNIALILAGDFDPNKVVQLAEKYFGNYQRQEVPPFTFGEATPRTGITETEVFGQEAPYVDLAWRFNGANSEDAVKLLMLKGILHNNQAGLMDININQKQKALETDAWHWIFEDYSVFGLYGKPREGQTLKEVQQLMIGEVEKIKEGAFDDWLMNAVIKDMKLGEIRANQSNRARAGTMTNAFIWGMDWAYYVNRFEQLKALTKADIVQFANERLKDNYVVVYKREGENKNAVKVDKPAITPVTLNRENNSEFHKGVTAKSSKPLSPVFVDFKSEIKTHSLANGLQLDYIKNKDSETFSIDYIIEMGSNSDKILPLAVSYLPYLGTNKYSAEALQKEFFKLGLSFDVYSGAERSYITLSGLDESFEEGVALFEHVLANVQPDQKALDNVVADMLLKRENAKKDKYTILRRAMSNYAKYGKKSSFTDKLSAKALKALKPETLTDNIKAISNYEHRIFYYGSKTLESVKTVLNKLHNVPEKLSPVKPEKKYKELDTDSNKVYFVNFPMVQAEIMMVSKGTPQYSPEEATLAEFYNNYFGYGLSSIVFQEIRESKALAYSAFAFYASPRRKDQSHYLNAYIGTQADKLPDAIPAMMEIIENMPVSEKQIETARQSILKKIESDRITKTQIYWTQLNHKKLGIEKDKREDVYNFIKNATADDLVKFQKQFVKNRNYTFLVLGEKDKLDMDFLKKLGPVEELSLEEIFGY